MKYPSSKTFSVSTVLFFFGDPTLNLKSDPKHPVQRSRFDLFDLSPLPLHDPNVGEKRCVDLLSILLVKTMLKHVKTLSSIPQQLLPFYVRLIKKCKKRGIGPIR